MLLENRELEIKIDFHSIYQRKSLELQPNNSHYLYLL